MKSTSDPTLESLKTASPTWYEEQGRVKKQMSTLSSDIHRHMEQKYALLRKWNSLSPIDRLPDECLLSIFIFAEQAERVNASHPPQQCDEGRACCHQEYEGETVLAISQVCGRWRAIALAASRLWAKITLVIGNDAKSFHRQLHDRSMLLEYLERGARIAQLDLDLRPFPTLSGDVPTPERVRWSSYAMREDMDILAPYWKKCQRLCIHVPSDRWGYDVMGRSLVTRMPALECLHLRSSTSHGYPKVLLPFVGFRLRVLTVYEVDLYNLRPNALKGLSTLYVVRGSMSIYPYETLEINDEWIQSAKDEWLKGEPIRSRMQVHLGVVQACMRLKKLFLEDVTLRTFKDPEVVTLPDLVDLYLSLHPQLDSDYENEENPVWPSEYENSMLHFLTCVSMPALRTCSLVADASPQDTTNVVIALANARPPLVELSLKNFNSASAAEYLELLAALPLLEVLKLLSSSLHEDVFKGLKAKGEDTLVPNLRVLHINQAYSIASAEPVSREKRIYNALVQIVKSRKATSEVANVEELQVLGRSEQWTVWVRRCLMPLQPLLRTLVVGGPKSRLSHRQLLAAPRASS